MPITEETPDHSSLARVRDRLPLEIHAAVFQWVLALAAEKKLLPGKTVAVDATTLEADADTMVDSIVEARVNLSEAGVAAEIELAVADKAYNAVDTIELAESLGIRTYIPERKMRGARKWRDVPKKSVARS